MAEHMALLPLLSHYQPASYSCLPDNKQHMLVDFKS
jgi:hypothetical protein